MNAATPPRSPSAPAADGTVGFNVLCVRCGYNLRGLATNGMCPECAASVAESIRISRQGAVTPDAARLLADGAAWMALAAVVSMCSAMLPLEDVMRGVRLPLWKAGGTLVLAWVPAVAGWMGAMLVVSRAAMPTALGGAWNIARVLVMLLVTIGTGWWAVLAVADATGFSLPALPPRAAQALPWMMIVATAVLLLYLSRLAALMRRRVLSWMCRELAALIVLSCAWGWSQGRLQPLLGQYPFFLSAVPGSGFPLVTQWGAMYAKSPHPLTWQDASVAAVLVAAALAVLVLNEARRAFTQQAKRGDSDGKTAANSRP